MNSAPANLVAALGDRYRLERELGQGGMATVYLAKDLKHDREVALKVLRPELGAVIGPDRFLAEIKITAKLDHPHILTLIDSGAADGFLYYVLPLVRGESLREKLNREKQLSLEEALAITRQVASALDYAHRKGVVHRDIKPENILLQEGEAMLADFGIALAVKEAGGNRLTETGLSLGTPQYMSPEQATGDRQLDARSDVYSLGAVLYEMLAGEPPVTGPTAQAMIAKLMTERPTRLRVVRDTVPEGIETAVAKALSKVPADRPASAAEFSAMLAAGNRPETAARHGFPVKWAAAVGVLAVAGIAFVVSTRAQPARAPSPFAAAPPTQLTTSGHISEVVLSPEGSLVAYTDERCGDGHVCRGDLVIRETAGEGVNAVVSEEGIWAGALAWSPDGRRLMFRSWDVESGIGRGVFIVPERGGTPRRIASSTLVQGGFVSPDTIVLTPAEGSQHWLRRIVVSTGSVVDSILLPVGRWVDQVIPSPDGTRLLALHARSVNDSANVSVMDRSGRVTDSLRYDDVDGIAWSGVSNAFVVGVGQESGGLVVVRYRLDDQGRLSPVADTLRTLADPAMVVGENATGTQLLYAMYRLGEVEYWTATRADPRGSFQRGRKVASSTGALGAFISPRGGWVLTNETTTIPTGTRSRLTVEPFTGGASHILDPALGAFRDLAFSPQDDSLAVTTLAGPGKMGLNVYPLPSGAPVNRGTFDGVIGDLEWLSDGRLAAPVDSGRVIRIIGRQGEVQDIPVPDSLGVVRSMGRSPFGPELAVTTFLLRGDRVEQMVHRLTVLDGRFALVARTSTLGPVGGLWWTVDGWAHFPAFGPRDQIPRLHRVKISGGTIEAEPPIGFESNASVGSLAHDGRRAVVRVQSESNDLWVLRAP